MNTTHRTRTAAIAIAAAAAFTFAGTGAANAAGAIPLNGGQEAPAPNNFGAHGSFSYEIDGNELCYTLEVDGLSSPATAAHIHVAPRNVAGPVVVPLTVVNATSFEVDTCTTANPMVLAAIEADPKAYYVNVHNANNQPGEIRGQLK
ncbi:CHRD domain-containing protein [Agromyces sp. SYSU K20354]|uniref:CHRD domain-containing protein n=1 Tax=Agromyces cavernae TaxID=2898659 RepID=UPI001E303E22|nr:CHRD domain-containing protein [Agromyces cavernae]MCD2443817.1 CHRD domain-containing protein [Agromyces cavernae]